MHPNPPKASGYRFNGFSVDLSRRRVFGCHGEALPLSSRAYDVLLHLIEQRSRVVSKAELLGAAWPGLVVEENNLGQAISLLRRAFGDSREAAGVIATIPGRGYQFVSPVEVVHRSSSAISHPASSLAATRDHPAAPADRPSLVALPFVNLSSDPDQDYFVDGMMQEVISSLGRIRSLLVVVGSPAVKPDGGDHDPRAAARGLGVQYLLEGSVRRGGSKVRINVWLTHAASGTQIWSGRFEDTLEDVFALQDRVALSVAAAVEPNIAAAELRRVERSPVESLGCYDLYLRAAHLRGTLRRDDVIRALVLLEQALMLDPEYAPALALAAGCHSQIYVNRWTDDFELHRTKGLVLAERAERVAGDNASVLTHVANALMDLDHYQSHNIDRALALVERAAVINPGSAYTWFISGLLKLIDGDGDAAVAHLQKAVNLDPLSSLSDAARAHIALGRALQGAYEEALHDLRATSYRTPRIRLILACIFAELGQISMARAELENYRQNSSVPPDTMAAHMSRSNRLQQWMQEMFRRIETPPKRHVG